MNPVPIFVPFVNRPDLLKKAVDSVPLDDRWQVEVINNSCQPLPDDICAGVCNPCVPLTASQSFNWMQKLAKDWPTPFYIFMHNDGEAGEGTIAGLYQMALDKEARGDKWAVIYTLYDVVAVFNTAAFDAVGPWDQNLPQYFTDNDMYHQRLRLAGYERCESNLPVIHHGSQTINSDPVKKFYNDISFPIYRNYYIAKWGGEPGHEKFSKPWNGRFD